MCCFNNKQTRREILTVKLGLSLRTILQMNFSRLFPLASVQAQFGWEEYTVLAATLAVSAIIGVLFAWRGQRNTAEYLLANKQMGIFPTTMSIACSFISAITILGTPAEMYVYGTQYWAIGLSYPFVLAATAHCYLPVFYKLQARREFYCIYKKIFINCF